LAKYFGFIDSIIFSLFFKLKRIDSGDYIGRKLECTFSILFTCNHNLYI